MYQQIPNKRHLFPRKSWNFLILIVLAIGLLFRFVNLEQKIYWGDECFTSLMISGHTRVQIQQENFENKVTDIKELYNEYQKLDATKDLRDTLNALKKDVHPPLYYTLLYFWTRLFGDSVAVTRSLSAVISCLSFPCLYWLCLELFNSSLVGWMAILLMAISPFHLLYAQEARMYSLWTFTILLSSAALLRAVRLKTKFSWGLYSISLILGLYTFLFTGFVAIGHGLYILMTERCRWNKTFIYYLVSSSVSLLAFLPWLSVMATNYSSFQSATSWSNQVMSVSSLVNNWIYNLAYVFIDFFFIFTYQPDYIFNWHFGKYLIPSILILVAYSFYFLCLHNS